MCVCACVCVFTRVIFTASLPAISSSSAWRVPEPAGERNWVWPRVEVFCSQCCRVLLISKACAWEYSQTQKEWGRYHATLSLFKKKNGFERKRKVKKERETLICCSTYLCICWLILVCALTGDPTCNLGVHVLTSWATWPGQCHSSRGPQRVWACLVLLLDLQVNFLLVFPRCLDRREEHKALDMFMQIWGLSRRYPAMQYEKWRDLLKKIQDTRNIVPRTTMPQSPSK